MLPKQYRLDPKLIPLVARKGKRVSNEFLDIRVLGGGEVPQFAISISVKVSKSAVIRNRIRRRIRPILLELASSGKITPGKYLLIAKSAELADIPGLEDTLKNLLLN
ncbi:MAG: ribonuclease P protein component [Candidatus Doudnabacteria bacterium]|nr:ribonuclease P protein component [Candidatus Doudnabacteria bacterium]